MTARTNPYSAGEEFDSAAAMYDQVLVPAFFDSWAAEVTTRLGPPGDLVVDVACGTGVLAPHLIGAGWGRVMGVDLSEGMLDRAHQRTAGAEWIVGDAAALPLGDGAADGVASSFGLMFMPDPAAALREMGRVARAGAPVMVSTWGHLDVNGAFHGICAAVEQVGGSQCTRMLRTAFSLGDDDELAGLAARAGFADARVTRAAITARFACVADIARAYASPLGVGDASATDALEAVLDSMVEPWMVGGAVEFGMEGLILEATGRGGS